MMVMEKIIVTAGQLLGDAMLPDLEQASVLLAVWRSPSGGRPPAVSGATVKVRICWVL
jgi:hypothetical protein